MPWKHGPIYFDSGSTNRGHAAIETRALNLSGRTASRGEVVLPWYGESSDDHSRLAFTFILTDPDGQWPLGVVNQTLIEPGEEGALAQIGYVTNLQVKGTIAAGDFLRVTWSTIGGAGGNGVATLAPAQGWRSFAWACGAKTGTGRGSVPAFLFPWRP